MYKCCKNCDYYVNKYEHCDYYVKEYELGKCYARKDAPFVKENYCCENWKKYSGNTMIEEKEYTQSDLNNAIVKAITDMTTVLERQEKEIYELKNAIYILMGDK